MSAELGRRLRAAVGRAAPTPASTDRARAVALDALPCSTEQPRRRIGAIVVPAFAALAVAGVAMAATSVRPAAPDRAVVPASVEAHASTNSRPVAELRDGRGWITRPDGARISQPATAVTVSPAGLFAAFGSDGRLTVTDLGGRARWTRRVPGTVVDIAWAPYPTYIAYTVRHGGRLDVRLIWANGTHDRLFAGDVTPGRLRWSHDTEALNYGAPGARVTQGRDTVRL